jgi:hypothetical protein
MRIEKKIQIEGIELVASYETESYEMRIGIPQGVMNDYETLINKNPFKVVNAVRQAFASENLRRIAFQASAFTESAMKRKERFYDRTLKRGGFTLIEEYKAGLFSDSKRGIFSGVWFGPYRVYERRKEKDA